MGELTKGRLDTMPPGDRPFIIWDRGRLPGFGIKVLPTGRKVFILDTRISGKSRRLTLGLYGPLSLDAARKLASDRLGEIARGGDPVADRRAARTAANVSNLCDLYLEAAEAGLVVTRFGRPKKPSTVAIDRGMIVRHIKPLVGHVRIDRLTRADVQKMIDAIASGKTQADERTKPRGRSRVTGGTGIATRTAELLGGIWTWGTKRGHAVGPSPSSGTDRYRSQPADRRLSQEELNRLGAAMQKASLEWLAVQDARDAAQKAGRKAPTVRKGLVNTSAVALCRLMALTGMRPGEAAALRWDEIDVSSQTMTLQDTKTGRSRRPLGRPALELMKAIERSSDRWVFPSNRGQRHSPHKKSLVELFRLASIDASPKVLRSTFASVAADLGYSGGTIGEMLGHARQGVTERHYIRRVDQVLIAAADEVSAAISAAMGT